MIATSQNHVYLTADNLVLILQDESFARGNDSLIKGKKWAWWPGTPLPKKWFCFSSGFWGASLGSKHTPIPPPTSCDGPSCICPPNPSWMNKARPVLRGMILLLPVLARGVGTMWFLSDFLQCWFLPPDQEVITTIPGILNKFLLLEKIFYGLSHFTIFLNS